MTGIPASLVSVARGALLVALIIGEIAALVLVVAYAAECAVMAVRGRR